MRSGVNKPPMIAMMRPPPNVDVNDRRKPRGLMGLAFIKMNKGKIKRGHPFLLRAHTWMHGLF